MLGTPVFAFKLSTYWRSALHRTRGKNASTTKEEEVAIPDIRTTPS
jgi:hypothetical protein